MGKNYDRQDYSDLLYELNGNTVIKAETDNEIQDKIDTWYKESLEIVYQLILYGQQKDIDYVDHIERVKDMFRCIKIRDVYWKEIQSRMKCYDKKDIDRIMTWLSDILYAYKVNDDELFNDAADYLLQKSRFRIYVLAFTRGIEPEETAPEIKIVRPESEKLHRILSDEKIKFVYDRKTNIIHDKTCSLVKKMPDSELYVPDDYLGSYIPCKECQMKAYIRLGAKDIKEYDSYVKLFDLIGADLDTIRRIYVTLRCKTRISHMCTEGYRYSNLKDNAITIWCREDAWRIGVTDAHCVRLEHNNYRLLKQGKREFTQGFHIQNDKTYSTSLNYALSVISSYNFEDHLEAAQNRSKATLEKYESSKTTAQIPETKVIINQPIGSTALHGYKSGNFIIRFLSRIGRVLFGDRICHTHKISENQLPDNNEICLYKWHDKSGHTFWSCGRYKAAKKQFEVNYDNQTVVVTWDRVIEWKAMDEIGI